MQRLTAALLVLDLVGAQGGHWQELRRVEPLHKFDRSVLGNLRSSQELLNLRASRDRTFVASITVGTPPQELRCLLDSSFADLWVPSKKCVTCENKHHFHAGKSSTFIPERMHTPQGVSPWMMPIRISHGTREEIMGFLVQDTVGFGSMTIKNQSFLIVEEAALPQPRSWDGVCGLGWKQLATVGAPLHRHLQATGGHSVFTLAPTLGGQVYIVVGEVPAAAYKPGSLVWVPAEALGRGGERSFWAATGGVAIHGRMPARTRFVLDTGTSFLLAPRKHFTGIVRALLPGTVFDDLCGQDPNAGNLVVCDCAVTQPSADMAPGQLRVYLGGREFALNIPQLFKRTRTDDGGDLCLLQIQPNPMASLDPLELLGDILGSGGVGGSQGPSMGHAFPAGGSPVPPFPFPLPMLLPNATKGLPFLAAQPGGGEQIEEVVKTLPNGTICTHTLVWEAGRLKGNSTHCGERGRTGTILDPVLEPLVKRLMGSHAGGQPSADKRRRLQQVPVTSRGSHDEDALEELWVLGGAFLEQFVIALDFERERIGIAEPSESPAMESALAAQGPGAGDVRAGVPLMVRPDAGAAAPQGHLREARGPAGERDEGIRRAPAATLVVASMGIVALLLTAMCACQLLQKMKRRKNLADSLGDAEDDGAE